MPSVLPGHDNYCCHYTGSNQTAIIPNVYHASKFAMGAALVFAFFAGGGGIDAPSPSKEAAAAALGAGGLQAKIGGDFVVT